MSHRFVTGQVIAHRTAGTARRRLPVYRVVLPIQLIGPGGRFEDPVACQWDTGAELSVMSEAVARDHGIPLDDEAEETTLTGVTGAASAAWLVPRFVRFPGLDGFRFRLHFLVHKGSADPLPLPGMRDTYRNFEVVTQEDEVYFFLKGNHTGQPG